MRQIYFTLLVLLASTNAWTQDTTKVKEEIRKLYADWNRARISYDRKALHQLFADEYIWVHGFGYADDKATAINDQMTTDSIGPVPVPNLDGILVYGDVAVLRRLNKNPQGSNFNSSIFTKKDGQWRFTFSQTTLFQPDRKFITMANTALQAYSTVFESGNRQMQFRVENDTLTLYMPKVPRRRLLPVADNRFFDKLGAEYIFHRNESGELSHVVVKPQLGAEATWRRKL